MLLNDKQIGRNSRFYRGKVSEIRSKIQFLPKSVSAITPVFYCLGDKSFAPKILAFLERIFKVMVIVCQRKPERKYLKLVLMFVLYSFYTCQPTPGSL